MSEKANRTNESAPVDRLSQIWRRIYEHKVAQWAVGYIALAYGIQHGTILVSESLEWPNAVARATLLVLALVFPLVVTFAWYHGARASRNFSQAELSIVSVLLVIASLLFFVFVRPERVPTSAAVQPPSVASLPKGGVSLAVLPFLNMSSDKEQEFFSDGMTEEITAALAQVKGLRVVGRTSAFAFKGQNKDLRAVGQALGATHVIEGSVRKAGNRLRITAQLVKADDDSHLWAQNYDRELNDVFAIQEEIAQAIAVSLQVPLGLRRDEALVTNRVTNTELYQDYLRARALYRARSPGTSLKDALGLLDNFVAREPNYAPAWALLAEAYGRAPYYDPIYQKGSVEEIRRFVDDALPRAEAAARRAIQLDPRNADAFAALGATQMLRGPLTAAEQSVQKALNIDPLNPQALHRYSIFMADIGRVREAVAVREQLRAVDPLVPIFNAMTDRIFLAAGDNNRALAIAESLPVDYPLRAPEIARAYATMKRYREAADVAQTAPREFYAPGSVDAAARLLRTAPMSVLAQGVPYLGDLSFAFLYSERPERALEQFQRDADAGYLVDGNLLQLWQADYASARKTQRFKDIVRKLGLVDYWRAKGWPPQCHPTTDDDFECS
jgi:TolB-like protein